MAAKCDWAAVERDYRTGCYTNRELGRRHNVSEGSIRNRATKEEWQKDLSEMIRQRVREKTGRAAAAVVTEATNDAEIVEQAAEAGIDCFVAGSAVYGTADPAATVRALRAKAAGASKHLSL